MHSLLPAGIEHTEFSAFAVLPLLVLESASVGGVLGTLKHTRQLHFTSKRPVQYRVPTCCALGPLEVFAEQLWVGSIGMRQHSHAASLLLFHLEYYTPVSARQGRSLSGLGTAPPVAVQKRVQDPSSVSTRAPALRPPAESDRTNLRSWRQITCLTIGTRGDVQPYIALCLGLQKYGHTCTIATHPDELFKQMVEKAGIRFKSIGGNPQELIDHCVEYGFFSPSFYTKGFTKFHTWLSELTTSAYKACEGADLLIESPTAMVGIHIAEKMQIPYFRAFTMPWTTTKKYPHAFAVTDRDWGEWYNYATYSLFDFLVWRGISLQVNRWRRKDLKLERTSYRELQAIRVPFLYNFSQKIVPKPADWGEHIHLTGYWFVDQHQKTESHDKAAQSVPQSLKIFIEEARAQDKKIIYIGFGSVDVPDASKVQEAIEKAVDKANVRAILAIGSSKMQPEGSSSSSQLTRSSSSLKENDHESKSKMESQKIFYIKSVSHDWLFPQVDAAFHHGGAGTTAASIRAGLPTLIRPFLGDQFFWAHRVEELGIGTYVKKFEVDTMTKAFIDATNPDKQKKVQKVGKEIQAENGVEEAIHIIFKEFEYAQALMKNGLRNNYKGTPPHPHEGARKIARPEMDKGNPNFGFLYLITAIIRSTQFYSMYERANN
ncbi:hypothetical protein O181_014227 [Austropuccinia psidii MF-1]|uniref:sterol 3beta-glucosyltransferase n=1 Tax=Austropuccinia psidii MF-1 TaxID=1389203 RepID=A0A9Q3C187_9BASI|nr:hypothetical protein [Austropuccinia psidii MF-1]